MTATATETPAATPAKKSRTTKRRTAKKSKTAAAAPKKSPPIKVDTKAALAYVRSKLRSEKDVFAIAFLEDELKTLEAKLQAEEEAHRKSLFITVNKETVKIGDHLFSIENYGGRYYHRGRAQYSDDIPRVVEYVIKNILPPENTYSGKRATVNQVGRGGHQILGQYDMHRMYTSRESALDHALNETVEALTEAREQVVGLEVQQQHLETLRRGEEIPMAPAEHPNEGKRWTPIEKTQLRDAVKDKKSLEEMVEQFGRSRDTIVRQMHKLGIKDPSIPFHDFRKSEAPPAIPAPEAIVQSEDFAEQQPELAVAS